MPTSFGELEKLLDKQKDDPAVLTILSQLGKPSHTYDIPLPNTMSEYRQLGFGATYDHEQNRFWMLTFQMSENGRTAAFDGSVIAGVKNGDNVAEVERKLSVLPTAIDELKRTKFWRRKYAFPPYQIWCMFEGEKGALFSLTMFLMPRNAT